MNKQRILVTLALALLLIGGGLAIWNAGDHSPEPAEPTRTEDPSQVVGQNVSFTVTEGAVKKWKLEAAKAVYSEDRTEAKLSEVKGEFYDQSGAAVLHFTAPKGEYTNKNNAVVLTGGVVAQSTDKDGGELRAPTMAWSAKTNKVVASGGIALTFPQGKSTAQTCRFNLDFSNLALEGGVTSVISP